LPGLWFNFGPLSLPFNNFLCRRIPSELACFTGNYSLTYDTERGIYCFHTAGVANSNLASLTNEIEQLQQHPPRIQAAEILVEGE
jgi:hypothetical protein